jgi:hypothetical protein
MRWPIRVVIPSLELAITLLYSGTATRCVAQPPDDRAPARRQRAPSPKSVAYIDLKCGFKFTFSSLWTVTRESIPLASDSCDYRIIFTRKASNGLLIRHHVEVSVFDCEFEGFEKDENYEFRDGVWHRDRGMAGKADAHEIRGINWVGMSMLDGPARCFGNEGYEGIGDRPTAELFGQTIKRAAELDGGECEDSDEEGIQLMLPNFEFIPVSSSPMVR